MIVERWTAAEVRALRVSALRDTQEQFARRIGWKVPTVRKWERLTDGRTVRGDRAETLDTVLPGLTPDQLRRFTTALALPAPPVHPGMATAGLAVAPEEDADVRRRDFGKLAAMTATSLPAWTQPPVRIAAEEVRQLAAAADALQTADQQVGGVPLVDAAVTTLERAFDLLNTSSYDDATGRAFMTATGKLAVQTGWLAFDADRHMLARRYYSDALSLASASADPDLTARACLCAALQAITLARAGQGSPSYALTLISRARDLMRGRPPGRIHALIAAREAGVYALLGDTGGFGRATATAWRELDAALNLEPLGECPQWLRFVTPSEVRAHEARAYTDIGDPARALTLYEVACAEFAQPRNAVNVRALLAEARLAVGDAPGALEEAEPVLADLEGGVVSARTVKALAPVRAAARELPAGADFAARFEAVTTTIRSTA